MVYRKRRRRRPKRTKTPTKSDSLDRLLKRIGLYACLAVAVLIGVRYYGTLKTSAADLDAPYQRITVFKGKLGGNDLRDGLLESGSSPEEAKKIVRSLRRIGGIGRLHKGDHYRIVRSTGGAFRHATLTRGRKMTVVTPEGDGFKTTVMDTPMRRILRTAEGGIKGSLWLSMTAGDVSPEIIQEFADVFQWTVDFLTEPREGDRYAVVWTVNRTPDGRVWGREIRAALYHGKRTGRQVGVLFEGDYYDEKGQSLRRIFLRAPLNFRRISSYFSNRRFHPILRRYRPHHGIDYAAPRGTPVVAVGSGRVTRMGRRGGLGKAVEIRHTNVYTTLYGHLSRYGRGIKRGVRVRQGQVIGYVGSTGLSTGPHLDFRISRRGSWVNFLRLKLPKMRSLPKKKKPAFDALLKRHLQDLEPGNMAAGGAS